MDRLEMLACLSKFDAINEEMKRADKSVYMSIVLQEQHLAMKSNMMYALLIKTERILRYNLKILLMC